MHSHIQFNGSPDLLYHGNNDQVLNSFWKLIMHEFTFISGGDNPLHASSLSSVKEITRSPYSSAHLKS
jgi:hypothetical protein